MVWDYIRKCGFKITRTTVWGMVLTAPCGYQINVFISHPLLNDLFVFPSCVPIIVTTEKGSFYGKGHPLSAFFKVILQTTKLGSIMRVPTLVLGICTSFSSSRFVTVSICIADVNCLSVMQFFVTVCQCTIFVSYWLYIY